MAPTGVERLVELTRHRLADRQGLQREFAGLDVGPTPGAPNTSYALSSPAMVLYNLQKLVRWNLCYLLCRETKRWLSPRRRRQTPCRETGQPEMQHAEMVRAGLCQAACEHPTLNRYR